jgi:hypothetical protein
MKSRLRLSENVQGSVCASLQLVPMQLYKARQGRRTASAKQPVPSRSFVVTLRLTQHRHLSKASASVVDVQ